MSRVDLEASRVIRMVRREVPALSQVELSNFTDQVAAVAINSLGPSIQLVSGRSRDV